MRGEFIPHINVCVWAMAAWCVDVVMDGMDGRYDPIYQQIARTPCVNTTRIRPNS